MKYTVTLRFILLTLGAFLVMITLFYCDRKNYSGLRIPFKRHYEAHPLNPIKKIPLGFSSSRILDIVKNDILILDSRDGTQLHWVDTRAGSAITYDPPGFNGQMITAAWYDQEQLYVYNGNGKTLLQKERFPENSEQQSIRPVKANVVRAIPIGKGKMLLRLRDSLNRDCHMAIYNAGSDTHYTDNWPKRNINCNCLGNDGIFAYDGRNNMFYVNFYNSRVLKFDSTLATVDEYATIDNQKTLPSVHYDEKTKTSTFYSPHRVVNAFAAADTSYLYVLSYASASNDLNSVLRDNAPVDRYSAKTGEYSGSYQLHGVNINEVNDLKIKDGVAYLLTSDNKIFTYKFD